MTSSMVGADTLEGVSGAIFVYETDPLVVLEDTGIDDILDFSLDEGDALHIADLLIGYDPLVDAISDFVQITDDGTDSTIAVDQDGGANNFVDIAVLDNTIGLNDVLSLEHSGNLITV